MPGIMDYVKFEQIWHIIYGMCMQSSMDYNGFWFYHSCLRICILFISKEYASCLFVLFIFGILMAALITYYYSRMKETLEKGITSQMENYLNNPKDMIMDRLQAELECCGNMEPNDWLRTSTGEIPPSCCKFKLCDTTKMEEIYNSGCLPKLMTQIQSYRNTLTVNILFGCLLLLIGSMLSFANAYHSVNSKYQEVK
ncbi:tetraspanin-6-like isoform X3 [Rhodnius prolixus]|uniref:tetraspanin-6-like isoform X3 n=1 Tax=Rhodnius prolixus TaxID=13249 RepID=UPI003D189461